MPAPKTGHPNRRQAAILIVVTQPGFIEADRVAHSGPVASGSFIQTLVLTDIATGWTECAPLLVREQTVRV